MEHILTTKGTMPKPEQALTGASIPEYIEIKTATGNTVAFLSPRSDGIDECWISDEQNGACTLEFTLPIVDIATERISRTATVKGISGEVTTPAEENKWQYLTDQYRIYANDKEFVILNPDAIDRKREGKKLTGRIKAHESWVLLGKKFRTVSNDPQNQNSSWSAVIILSGGAPKGGFAQGSAGSALSWLLEGTGWTVGTVDVAGTYDLETEKESVLANINAIQQKWGGILVWDSINKTVSLRDEETWKNYTGYQIRYAKNLKGISRTDDYDIVTRLYPFGENDLNIANVNGGLLYLDNQSYSAEILEGVWYNQELTDQNQLKAQAEKQLAVMCSPRHNYKTEILDLRSLPGYGHETFARSDVVDLCDEDLGTNVQVRIIRRRHNVFQPWLCDLELGDPLEKISATVAQTILMAKFYKNVVKPNESFQNLLKALINTKATEINGASGDYTLVDGVSTWFDRDEQGILTGKMVRITPQGLIISFDGGQTWKLAISGEGIHADAGWVGKLNAGVVTVGAGTTFEAGYDPSAKNSTYAQDADPVTTWTRSEYPTHVDDTWYSQAEQKTRIFKNSDAYFFNLGVGGGSVISGYAGSSFSTLGRPVPISYFGIKGATSGIGNLYLWKLDSAFKFVELVATGNAVYEDGGANYHCELTLEANTNYAIIASVMYGNISRINGSSVISNDYVTGVLDKNYVETSAPTAGTELTAAMEHKIRLGIYGWIDVEDATANSKNAAFSTCPSNGKYKKDDIMIPAVGFVSGAKTFYAGEIYQALADGDGVAFNSAHWTEASLLSSWKKTGTTTIDGGQIAADTIAATQLKGDTAMVNFLNALNITAKYVSANGITAGTINSDNVNVKSNDGNLNIANAEITIKHNNGTKSKLNNSGLKLYESLTEIPYITPIDGGNITASTSGWSGSNGDGYDPSKFTIQKRGKLWVGKASKTVCIPIIAEAIRWIDPEIYRDDGVREAACKVYEINNVATTTDRTSTLPDQSGMSANQVKLDSGASGTDDAYNGTWITVDGVSRKISDYTGSTRVAIVEESFDADNLPQLNDAYTIETIGGVNVVIESWKKFLSVDGSNSYTYYWRLAFNYLVILKG